MNLDAADMEPSDFKDFARSIIDFSANYLENIRERIVLPKVEPGYLRPMMPSEAPEKSEHWQSVMKDIETLIMPGITHWQSPKFLAYYPSSNSYSSIVAEMLSSAIGCLGFSWMASPAYTELEVVMLDWLGKLIDLPRDFLTCSGGKGGGVIQSTASESTLVALLGAKAKKIQEIQKLHSEWDQHTITSKLVGYRSTQAHSSVERAALLVGVKLRTLPVDKNYSLRGNIFEDAIKEDLAKGLIPFYVLISWGTTNSCAFDNLDECGPVANRYNVWIHIDAAYAGSAFICPEYRYLMKGIETADSFNFNLHKWMMMNSDLSAMWMKEPSWVIDAFNVAPIYLKHNKKGSVPDFRHWTISLERKFRALKVWIVLRLYGVNNLQAHVRRHCLFAKKFEKLCRGDQRFEIVAEVVLGLVCFRLKGSNEINQKLLKLINSRGNIHMISANIEGSTILRMAVCSSYTVSEDMTYAWNEVSSAADEILYKEFPSNGLKKWVKMNGLKSITENI